MLCIVARYEEHILRWPISQSEARLGASSDNEIVLPFPGVSRRHAVVSREGPRVRLVDLESKNGLLVDGRRCAEALLCVGESVQIGRVLVTLQDSRTSEVELVLRLSPPDHSQRAYERLTSRADATGNMAAVLRVVRQAEEPSRLTRERRRRLTEDARLSLRAFSMMAGYVGGSGDLAIEWLSGTPPPVSAGEAVLRSVSARRRSGFAGTQRIGDEHIVCAGRGDRFVVAAFDHAPEPWTEDFIAFLAGKLLHAAPESDDSAPDGSADGLVLPPGLVVGTSELMQRLLAQMRATVGSAMDVLLSGETGTGKELFARIVHASVPTRRGDFVAINCAAIPGELLEAELFGVHGRVATGVDARPGIFVQADHGSIFLDEIGELAEHLQAKLLRVLQEREVLAVGASRPRSIDVRVISASNRDLASLVSEGRFRADLYYRLRGLQFHIPPLRERKEDIAALVLEFAARAAAEYRKDVRGVSRKALQLLEQHDWPGNIRELESEVRRAVLLCPRGASLQPEHLAVEQRHVRARADAPAAAAESDAPSSLRAHLEAAERAEIERALLEARGNRSRAARILGITRNGLALKLRRLEMERSD